MGWSKYLEDDIGIFCDRVYMAQEHKQNRSENYSYLNVTPVQKITIEFAKTPAIKQHSKKALVDKHLVCCDCGEVFLFSKKSQDYFEKMGWHDPKRCKACRKFNQLKYAS